MKRIDNNVEIKVEESKRQFGNWWLYHYSFLKDAENKNEAEISRTGC